MLCFVAHLKFPQWMRCDLTCAYIFGYLRRFSAQLGEHLADLHLHNQKQREKHSKEEQTIGNVL